MRLSAIVSTCALVLLLAACDRDHVRIIVTPRPDGSFVRSLRITRVHAGNLEEEPAPASEELLVSPDAVYGKRSEDAGLAANYRGTFREVPPDLEHGGSKNRGGLLVWSSVFGEAGAYRERFPGRESFHADAVEIGRVVDGVTGALAVLAEERLAGEEGVEKLAAALRGPIRRDAKDLLTLFLATALLADADMRPEAEGRPEWISAVALQFLEDRGYLRIESLSGIHEAEDLEEFALAWVARTMGREPDEGLRAKLELSVDDGEGQAAFGRACEKVGYDPMEHAEFAEAIADSIVSFDRPRVRLQLQLPVEPFLTNGAWDEKLGAVLFETDLDGNRIGVALAYAVWAEPDRAAQEKALGQVALVEEDLVELARWESSLTDELRAGWREAVGKLDPSGDLEAQLRGLLDRWKPGAEMLAKAVRSSGPD
jgi:hypothetical protein